MPPAVESLPHEMQLFARYLESERRASPHTLKGYLTDLGQFAAYLAELGEPLVPGSSNAIRGFLARASGESGATSLARKLSAIRSLYRFLVREGLAPANPGRTVSSPKRPKRLPEVLLEEEVAALVTAPEASVPLALRDRAFLELL
ncbi:MAG TPA: site-specific integrase, partial [Anaeromyxobacteraceae bacterium]|nr:site-specific integrase [Anaeromyxobacteraceae bacterium]